MHFQIDLIRVRMVRNGVASGSQNHHFGSFDESGGGLTFHQTQFPRRVGSNDCGDVLACNGERYLRQQSFYLEVDNAAHELISAADVPKLDAALLRHILAGGAIQVAIKFAFRDAMVPASGLNRAQLFGVDPAL